MEEGEKGVSRIICGDALTELKKLPDESVHCCVTSDASVVQFFAAIVETVTHRNVFIGKGFVSNLSDGTVRIWEVSKSSHFRSVFCSFRLKSAELYHSVSNILFDFQIWSDCFDNFLCPLVCRLVAVKWSTLGAIWFFFIVPSPQGFRDKFNSVFVHHADLNSCMEAGGCSFLAFIAPVLFDADITFSVHQSSDIGNVCFLHYITPVAWFLILCMFMAMVSR